MPYPVKRRFKSSLFDCTGNVFQLIVSKYNKYDWKIISLCKRHTKWKLSLFIIFKLLSCFSLFWSTHIPNMLILIHIYFMWKHSRVIFHFDQHILQNISIKRKHSPAPFQFHKHIGLLQEVSGEKTPVFYSSFINTFSKIFEVNTHCCSIPVWSTHNQRRLKRKHNLKLLFPTSFQFGQRTPQVHLVFYNFVAYLKKPK